MFVIECLLLGTITIMAVAGIFFTIGGFVVGGRDYMNIAAWMWAAVAWVACIMLAIVYGLLKSVAWMFS